MAKKKPTLPTARQLPSGNWTVQLRLQGQSISITRPTQREAVAQALAIKEGIVRTTKTPGSRMTLHDAIDDYISQRENILSPATIAGYRVIQRNRFQSLQSVRLCDIDPVRWQRAVNTEAKTLTDRVDENGIRRPLSSKTLKNSAMFIQTVIAEYSGERLTARLPQVVPNDLPWLTPEQIPLFLQAISGNKYEIPALLALSGLRQSEIVALHWGDIDTTAGTITVHGAAVLDDDGNLIQKAENKNASSRRTVPFLIPQLREAVLSKPRDPKAHVYPHYSNVLRQNINRICESHDLPQIGVHGLRRSFASLCYHLGISEAVTMLSGGWSDFRTMRKIYTKISAADIQTQAEKFSAFFKSANKIANEE